MSWITIACMQCTHAVLLIQTIHLLKSDKEAWKQKSIFLLLEVFIVGAAFFLGKEAYWNMAGSIQCGTNTEILKIQVAAASSAGFFLANGIAFQLFFSMLLRKRLPFFWNYSLFPMAQWCVLASFLKDGAIWPNGLDWYVQAALVLWLASNCFLFHWAYCLSLEIRAAIVHFVEDEKEGEEIQDREAERFSRIRHDRKNHLLVAHRLLSMGKGAEAQQLLLGLCQTLDKVEEKG